MSNSVFNSFAITVDKNSDLTALNIHIGGAFATYVPIQLIGSSAYIDVCTFSNSSDDYNIELSNSSIITLDGAIISTSTTQFALVDTMSELNILAGNLLAIDSSTSTTAIEMAGRSRLLVNGAGGTISSSANCIELQNGSQAYFADVAWTNSGAGAGFIKVGSLAAQAGPIADEFDALGVFSVLNI